MKVIAFDRHHDKPMELPPRVDIIIDSAVTLPGRPFFLPDFDTEWSASLYMAVRINRLGKNISAKFASRYFDAISVALRLTPANIADDMKKSGGPCGLTGLFDNALALGKWLPVTEAPATLSVSTADTTMAIGDFNRIIAESITSISKYCTLKMGDVILPCLISEGIPVTIGYSATASIGSEPCLSLTIK